MIDPNVVEVFGMSVTRNIFTWTLALLTGGAPYNLSIWVFLLLGSLLASDKIYHHLVKK